MKVAGFTFVRNAIKYDYPVVESIESNDGRDSNENLEDNLLRNKISFDILIGV